MVSRIGTAAERAGRPCRRAATAGSGPSVPGQGGRPAGPAGEGDAGLRSGRRAGGRVRRQPGGRRCRCCRPRARRRASRRPAPAPTGRAAPGSREGHGARLLRGGRGRADRRRWPRRPYGSRRHWPASMRCAAVAGPVRTTTESAGHAVADHLAGAVRRVDAGADLGCVLTEVLVERVLVLQAAHQAAARPGDAQRVDRQLLVLGHPHRDRLEVLQERGAAGVPAARADAALQPGLVARADLPQLDPAAQPGGQVADQGPEVDPVRRAEVDRVARSRCPRSRRR